MNLIAFLFSKSYEQEIDKDRELARKAGRILVEKYVNDRRQVERLCQYVSKTQSAHRDFALNTIIVLLSDPRTSAEARRLCEQTMLDVLPSSLRDVMIYPDEAVRVVAGIQDARKVPLLLSLLKDSSVAVCQYAAGALAKTGDRAAVAPLVDALANDCVQVWVAAALALKELGWQPDDKTEATSAAAFWIATKQWERCADLGTSAVTPLLSWFGAGTFPQEQFVSGHIHRESSGFMSLQDDKAAIAATIRRIGMPALSALVAALRVRQGNWKARRDVEILIMNVSGYYRGLSQRDKNDALNSSSFWQYLVPRLLESIYGILSAVNDRRAVDLLIAALDDQDQSVRELAARLLGEIADHRAVRSLSANFGRVPLHIVAEALANIGGTEATEALVARLQRRDKNEVLPTIAEALGRIGSPEAREVLATNLKQGGRCVARPLALAGDDRGVAWLMEDVRRQRSEESAVALGMAYRSSRLTDSQKTQITQQGSLRVDHTGYYTGVPDEYFGAGQMPNDYYREAKLLRDYL